MHRITASIQIYAGWKRGGQRAHHYPYVNFTIHRFSLEVETTWFFLVLLEEPFLPQHMNMAGRAPVSPDADRSSTSP